jgi:hypothetical protein
MRDLSLTSTTSTLVEDVLAVERSARVDRLLVRLLEETENEGSHKPSPSVAIGC